MIRNFPQIIKMLWKHSANMFAQLFVIVCTDGICVDLMTTTNHLTLSSEFPIIEIETFLKLRNWPYENVDVFVCVWAESSHDTCPLYICMYMFIYTSIHTPIWKYILTYLCLNECQCFFVQRYVDHFSKKHCALLKSICVYVYVAIRVCLLKYANVSTLVLVVVLEQTLRRTPLTTTTS